MFVFVLLFLGLSFWMGWRARLVVQNKTGRTAVVLIFSLLPFIGFMHRFLPLTWEGMQLISFYINSFYLVFAGFWVWGALILQIASGWRTWKNHRNRSLVYAQKDRGLQLWTRLLLGFSLILNLGFHLWGVPAANHFSIRDTEFVPASPLSRDLTIAVFSDIHLNPVFPPQKFKQAIQVLNQRKPDLIFVLGDVSDLSIAALERKGYDSLWRQLSAPMGVWVISGNHEAYAERSHQPILQWLNKQGSYVLVDSTVCLPELCITGRMDPHLINVWKPVRLPLQHLLPPADVVGTRPWIILDHQPLGLIPQEFSDRLRRPDLGLSGHTHAGQIFPWTIVIRWVWELAEGWGTLNGIPWFVSSGFGQWGPPLRVGSQTELVFLHLRQ